MKDITSKDFHEMWVFSAYRPIQYTEEIFGMSCYSRSLLD
jgi:hypothetical protein